MANKTKTKKVYSYKNFRGMDKENDAIKVSPFRAADGKNFVIDSESAVTRPGIIFKDTLPFFIEDGDVPVTWYSFLDVTLYVTKKHIYFRNKVSSLIFDEKKEIVSGADPDATITGHYINDFNFEQAPVFREEKGCLFIFGSGRILVFSYLRIEEETHYAFYEINRKPANPYYETEAFYEFYRDLPSPYEPTLFVGDKRLDDINLLSAVSKYKIFASTSQNEGDRATYVLPTHYDPEKHGAFDEIKDHIDVTFYKGLYSKQDVLPVFLGIDGEDFDLASIVENNGEEPVVKNTFFPKQHFEYSNAVSGDVISKIYGLKREDFFMFSLEDYDQTIFEYILDYINTNDITANEILGFSLLVQYQKNVRDETTNYLLESSVERENVMVYIEIRTEEIDSFQLVDKTMSFSYKKNHFGSSEPTGADFPSYPILVGPSPTAPVPDESLDLGIIKKNGFTNAHCESFATSFVISGKNSINDEDVVSVIGRIFEEKETTLEHEITLTFSVDWESSEEGSITWGDYSSFPSYPSFSNPEGHDVIEDDTVFISISGETINFDDTNIQNQIRDMIFALFDDLSGGFGSAFVKARIQTYYSDGGTIREKGVSVVVPFYFSKELGLTTYWTMQSFRLHTYIEKDGSPVDNDLYFFSFNEKEHTFELSVKDYFFDYNKEPSIEVRVLFQNNPNFDLVAKNKFGITFGSENRLFLAGHEDYPNVDRFNASNDLLGDGVKSQSFELSYFPSKNYRVMGGKGAINGYVIATDTQLYVTKAEYRNDDMFFIRERILSEEGLVFYKDYKTNISKTPLNDRCIVRFYNDVLILTKDGLFAIEISSNVLTNERLIKLRSGFINQDMVEEIEKNDHQDIFILEDNHRMYIFMGKTIYMADSRYVAENPHGIIDNVSYEIIRWETINAYLCGVLEDNKMTLMEKEYGAFYNLNEDEGKDDHVAPIKEGVSYMDMDLGASREYEFGGFLIQETEEHIFEDPTKYSIVLDSIFKVIARSNHFEQVGMFVTFDRPSDFSSIKEGETLYYKNTGVFIPFEVENLDIETMSFETSETLAGDEIYRDVSGQRLYISTIIYHGDNAYVRVSNHIQNDVLVLEQGDSETENDFEDRIFDSFGDESIEDDEGNYLKSDNDDYSIKVGMNDYLIFKRVPIPFEWISNITDLGNKMMEKTMFRAHVYASKISQENELNFGYRTMRKYDMNHRLDVDMANPFDFEGINFSIFSLSTFNNFGMSIPLKENNFLYIQFILSGYGRIELNSFEIIYKNNRMLKTIG